MKTGTALAGKRIACPDGHGVVAQILNPDVVLIRLDRMGQNGKNLVCKFDISECRELESHKTGEPSESEGDNQSAEGSSAPVGLSEPAQTQVA